MVKTCECGCGQEVKTKKARFAPGHNGKGIKRPEHERKKISETMKTIMTPEMRELRRINSTGRTHTEEAKAKMSKAAKMREARKKEQGWTHSQEARDKIGKAHKGRVFSEETLKKISESSKGKIISEAQRKQISQTLKSYYETHQNPFHGKKHSEETRKKMSLSCTGKQRGEKGSNWRGGINSFPYGIEWTKWLIQEIKERDENQCQNPYCKNPHKLLDVHHIDYDKTNNDKLNLVTICKRCHGKTQFKRRYWQRFYSILIKSKHQKGEES